jgi:hypothetical protein
MQITNGYDKDRQNLAPGHGTRSEEFHRATSFQRYDDSQVTVARSADNVSLLSVIPRVCPAA